MISSRDIYQQFIADPKTTKNIAITGQIMNKNIRFGLELIGLALTAYSAFSITPKNSLIFYSTAFATLIFILLAFINTGKVYYQFL
jgi:hypothetical protein